MNCLRLCWFGCLLLVLLTVSSSYAANIIVINTNDSGAGSLREAVQTANGNGEADIITFSLPLGSVITIDAELILTETGTTIDGDIDGDNRPDITILSGATSSGIVINTSGCVIQYLNFVGFSGAPNGAIDIDGLSATSNTIIGNYVGTDLTGNSTGTANYRGIAILNGASGNKVGDGTALGRNILGNNTWGVYISNASNNNTISGNYIGLALDGSTSIGNIGRGIEILSSSGNVIGVAGEVANYISNNNQQAIRLNAAVNTLMLNNLIGVDATGLLDRGNGDGIYILNGSNGSEVGDGTTSGRNVIAGNTQFGIHIEDSDNVSILGNYIGVGVDGGTSLGNGSSGPPNIFVTGTSANTQIGDGTAGGRNIISSGAGAGSSGINIGSGPTNVFGNYIGTDATGTLDLGNSTAGIILTGGSGQIGGNIAGQGNVISGNSFGIGVSAGGFDILGNYIGTDATGTTAIPNDDRGIRLSVGAGTNIGDGTVTGANVISGNTLDGILVENTSVTGNTINMNYIGVQSDGASPLGNGSNGVLIESDANGNTLSQNIIANNTTNGVEIGEVGFTGISNNILTQNLIYNNSGAGILITNGAQNGVTAPIITATTNGLIEGTADPGATIEIFADASDQGEQYLDFTTADGSGNWSLQINVSAINTGLDNISVTQTSGNNTSEFATALLEIPFTTTWVTTDGQITIPTTGAGYNYDITWTNLTNTGVGDGSITGQTGNYTITGLSNGDTYQVDITGSFPRIFFNNTGDKDKIQTVEQWGSISWSNMAFAFYGCTNLIVPATDAPDLSSTLSLNQMFRGATSFNESIDHWDVSNIQLFFGMFWDATSYNQPLNSWVLSSATDLSNMFHGATSFNQPLDNWVTTGITEIKVMFKNATSFNQPVNHFDVSLVTDFQGTFEGATSFNQSLDNWDVSSATRMDLMFFNNTAFNQPIGNWDVSNVTSFAYMFNNASSFDNNIGNWDISSATNMTDMLWNSGLSIDNYDNALIGWATLDAGETQIPTGITTFRALGLSYCNSVTERQSLIDTYSWDITLDTQSDLCEPLTQATNIIFSNITTSQMDVSWTNGNGSNRIAVVHAGSAVDTDPSDVSTYTASTVFGSGSEIGTGNYVIYNGTGNTMTLTGLTPGTTYHFRVYEYNGTAGNENYSIATTTGNPANSTTQSALPPFITTWQTTDGQVTIPTTGAGYNYDISWSNLTNTGVGDGSITGQTGNHTITGLSNGDTYQVEVTGSFPRIYFNNVGDKDKILTVEQWGSIAWTSMVGAFYGCTNLTISATDSPDLSSVTDISQMFQGALSFNEDISSWDVSNVTNMTQLFMNATAFNQNIGIWDVSAVTNMSNMFNGASTFNQDISAWNVSSVTNMSGMFGFASAFNQDIGVWNVTNVLNMSGMFRDSPFNQDISGWNVSKVTNMSRMFQNATTFNQNINSWNVSMVTDMTNMFRSSSFNQNIDSWNVSNVTSMSNMFLNNLSFNQSLGGWDVGGVVLMSGMLANTALSVANYDATLIGWEGLTSLQSGVTLGANGLFYCTGATAHANLISNYGWTITDAGLSCSPEPEIEVYEGVDNTGTLIVDGQPTGIDFGTGIQGTNIDVVFAIENTGTATLNITSITASGTDFSVISSPTTVTSGATENFTVRLSGVSPGVFNATITITNDDADEGTFDFSVTGTITAPEIAVYEGVDNTGTLIVDGQPTAIDFGTGVQGMDIDVVFAIENTGTATLNITSITASGTDFSVISAPTTVASGTTENFTIQLSGANTGTFNATVTIANDDADEGAFDFSVTGTITAPEIAVYEGVDNTGTPITDGQPTAIDFGTGIQGSEIDVVFAIENTGTATLNITSITASGTDFSVISAPTTVASGATENFTIQLSGANTGTFNATITIANDDADEGAFDFPVTGTINAVTAPEIAVYVGTDNTGASITNGQGTAIDFGSEDVGTDITQSFTIENTGTANLTVSGVSISGTAYSISGVPGSVAAGAIATFDVTLSGASVGIYTETLTINSDDTDEAVFDFPVTGEILGVNIVDDNTGDVIISNQDVNVGITSVNINIEKNFLIENLSSTQELLIQSITVDNPVFEIIDAPTSVPAQGTAQFTIRLIASQVGGYSGLVTVATNINDFSFNVTGEVISEGELPLTIFNVVTPNNDEKHAFFHIVNIETYANNVVSIFNRWGMKVFEVAGYNNNDRVFVGTSDEGKELDTGNYYYVIDKGNGDKAKTGFLLLKR